MILSTLITGLLASRTVHAHVVSSLGRHGHAAHHHHHPHADFRHLQETNTTSYSVEVSGISLMDVDTKIPDVSSDNVMCRMILLLRRFANPFHASHPINALLTLSYL